MSLRRPRLVDRLPETPPPSSLPQSPCIDVCKLNENGVCMGCKRTIEEIVQWPTMTPEDQWRVLHALPGRRI